MGVPFQAAADSAHWQATTTIICQAADVSR